MERLQKLTQRHQNIFEEQQKLLREQQDVIKEILFLHSSLISETNEIIIPENIEEETLDKNTILSCSKTIVLDLLEIFTSDINISVKIKDMRILIESFREKMSSKVLKREDIPTLKERSINFDNEPNYIDIFWRLSVILDKKYSLKIKRKKVFEMIEKFFKSKEEIQNLLFKRNDRDHSESIYIFYIKKIFFTFSGLKRYIDSE